MTTATHAQAKLEDALNVEHTGGQSLTLRVVASSMCTPLGMGTAAVGAALRARLCSHRQSSFTDNAGQPLRVSYISALERWGVSRWAWLLDQVLQNCMQASQVPLGLAPVVMMLAPERARPGLDEVWFQHLGSRITNRARFGEGSALFTRGKSGLGDALRAAQQVFAQQPRTDHILLLGVDSYLNAMTVNHYLAQDRLLTTTNSDGFIPGEAAAGLVLMRPGRATSGLDLLGMGWSHEDAHILQVEQVNRGVGLTQALRLAVQHASCAVADASFHISGISGESWYFKEAALALARATERRVDMSHHLIADLLGETGAASGPLILAYLHHVMARHDHYGRSALMHLSADEGQRLALMTRWVP